MSSGVPERTLRPSSRVVAPLGNDAVVAAGASDIQVETHDWGDVVTFGDGLSVRLHPAQHWSARGVRDRRMALYRSVVRLRCVQYFMDISMWLGFVVSHKKRGC